jgi:YjbE family integral membrane protein
MEIFSTEFLAALGAIILIDLVLAGDNAIVIALAARSLPAHLQRKAILWGTVGAIGVRTLMTVAVVWLLKIPGLLLAGGVLLVWIAVKLLRPDSSGSEEHKVSAAGFWTAMKTIVIADAVMGLDNVLAVAGAAHGSFLLVALGLLISIPIVVWGSTVVLHWVERFPVIVQAGSAILAWTAAKMILSEPLLKTWIHVDGISAWVFSAGVIALTLGLGAWRKKTGHDRASSTPVAANDVAMDSNVIHPSKEPVMMTSDSASAVPSDVANGDQQNHLISSDQRHILLPMNDSAQAHAALRHVVQQYAGQPRVKVHLLHVSPKLHRHAARFLSKSALARNAGASAQQAFAQARRLLATQGIAFEPHVVRALDASAAIMATAQRLGCERIVMGSVRKNNLLRWFTGSLTGRVLERASVPVEVVLEGRPDAFTRLGIPAGLAVARAAVVLD